ncbi:hypothetical protein Ndes2526B_g06832 [Nannochloris sp. 'desiccata']|nr:hypothetical protein KSW81_005066 [Chlorella desiccata (nom. nud.)]KAH7617940.1 hypothetical protein NADE_000142 [Chlorella desiccata (nom. nud.)]
MRQWPSRGSGHLALLATGPAVAVRYRTVGKAHMAPLCNGPHALVASLSNRAGCNVAECTDPNCTVHGPNLTPRPQPQVDPQSRKVASDGEFSWTEYKSTFGGIIGGSGLAALVFFALTMDISEPNEIAGGVTKGYINKIMKRAIVGFVTSVGGAVTYLEGRSSKSAKDLGKRMDCVETKMEKRMDRSDAKMDRNQEIIMKILLALSADVAFLKGADSKKK